MSYEKEVGPPKIVKYTYDIDKLFNIVSLRTNYRARNIKTESGKSLNDDFAISEDERDIFSNLLETNLYVTARTVMKLTNGVTDSVIYGPTEEPAVVSFSIKDHEAYNTNILGYVDALIKEYLVLQIMRDWYKLCGLDNEYKTLFVQALEKDNELVNGLFQLRKPLMT